MTTGCGMHDQYKGFIENCIAKATNGNILPMLWLSASLSQNCDNGILYLLPLKLIKITSIVDAGQLNECCDKLKKLRAQLHKFEELLAAANSQVCAPPPHPAARTNGAAPTQATR